MPLAGTALLLYACTSMIDQPAAEYDEESAPTVVIGYFSRASNLDAEPCPTMPGVEISCVIPEPVPNATLVVQEVLFGRDFRGRIDVRVGYSDHPERFPLGRDNPVIASVSDMGWGVVYLRDHKQLARTREREWAIPIATRGDLPDLPCSAERLLVSHAIDFMPPGPRRALDTYTEIERAALATNPRAHVDGDYVHIGSGVSLAEVRQARLDMPMNPDAFGPCLKK
jgi:hypothetical protein